MPRWTAQQVAALSKKRKVKSSKRIGRPKLEIQHYKFVLYGVDFDMNKILDLAKRGPHAYASYKKKQEDLLCKQLMGMPRIDFPARYVFYWYELDKRKDPDNIAASCKVVLDAFQVAGIIPNDGWGQVKQIHHYFPEDATERKLELEVFGI